MKSVGTVEKGVLGESGALFYFRGYHAFPMDLQHLIQMQLGLERIGLDARGHLSRIPGPDPDEIGLAYLYRTSTGVERAYCRADVPDEVAQKVFSHPFQDGEILKTLVQGREWTRFHTYLFPEALLGPEGEFFVSDGEKLRVEMREGGRVVAYCGSARENEKAAEAWVFVDENRRRRGLAKAIVSAWAAKVRERGKLAFYSHGDRNDASAGLARSLSLEKVFEVLIVTE